MIISVYWYWYAWENYWNGGREPPTSVQITRERLSDELVWQHAQRRMCMCHHQQRSWCITDDAPGVVHAWIRGY